MESTPRRELSLFDSICLIAGIIIGAGIFVTAPTVAGSVGDPVLMLAVWLGGGLLALAGALCYAELATTYPEQGGDYVYLKRAFGRWAGFGFGWSQLAIVRPGDIALMAFVFARYARQLLAGGPSDERYYAAAAIVVLSAINIIGVNAGKWTQNLLTVAKVAGIVAVVAVGLLAPTPAIATTQATSPNLGGIELALILVLFTYGGWNEMAYVAAEVKDPQRNIVRAMVLSMSLVIGLYLVVNGTFLRTLGFSSFTQSQAVAVDTVATLLPTMASRAVSVLICVSALGAVAGLTFTGARISYALGVDHAVFRSLGQWSGRRGTPIWALVAQGVVSLAIVLVAGSFIDTILYTAPVVWLFFFATATSVFVLRRREPGIARPHTVLGYPWTVFVFCACCLFMFVSCVSFALRNKPDGLLTLAVVLLAGIPVYWVSEKLLAHRARSLK